MRFVWDSKKAASNGAKHGVSFADAATAFGDPMSRTIPDPDHSAAEARFVLMGYTYDGRLVVVVHVDRGDTTRIISARIATSAERRAYEEES